MSKALEEQALADKEVFNKKTRALLHRFGGYEEYYPDLWITYSAADALKQDADLEVGRTKTNPWTSKVEGLYLTRSR